MDLSTLVIRIPSKAASLDALRLQKFIVPNTFNLQSRCDEAFESGSATAWLTGETWKYNIPPYTPMVITSGTGENAKTDYYVCSSICTKYPTEKETYVHNFNITEGTAILSCFIVGTKYFSTSGTHKTDSEKVEILCDLMNIKYGYEFSLEDGYEDLDEEIEYSFGSGSTLYDCLNEIAKHYNKRVKVVNLTSNKAYIDFIDIDSNVEYSSERIISATYSQNEDNYGRYLETEASNVVDKTTLVHAKNLTCKGDEVVITADNAHLEAPTPIDTVVDFGIQGFKRRIDFTIHEGPFYKYTSSGGLVELGTDNEGETFTISDIYSVNPTLQKAYNSELYKYWSLSTFGAKKVSFHTKYYYPTGADAQKYAGFRSYTNDATDDKNYSLCNLSLKDRILPKSKWDLLTDQEQANTCFYTNNSKTIDNLYCNYKNNIISQVLGHAGGPMLNADFPYEEYDVSEVSLTVEFEADSSHSNAPTSYVYYLDYYAISNPFLIDEKTSLKIDGDEYQVFSKSYSNSSSLIDFDKVSKNMNITNESQGREELQLEIDTTGVEIPSARSHMTYDGITWYISSAVTKFAYENITTTVNLVRNYNKVADCIGVDTQYNETKNPLNMIVTRPIYLGDGSAVDDVTYNPEHAYYMKLEFKFHGVTNTKTYYMPAVVMESSNARVFYCEADDQYSIMKRRGLETETEWWEEMWHPWSDTSSWYQVYNAYVDSNNECESVKASIVKFTYSLSKDGSLAGLNTTASTYPEKLPTYTGPDDYVQTVYTTEFQDIYKDAREKLTFTMKIKLT